MKMEDYFNDSTKTEAKSVIKFFYTSLLSPILNINVEVITLFIVNLYVIEYFIKLHSSFHN